MLWIKVFHIVFVVAWFAGLFYLPRLMVYHAATKHVQVSEQFKIMQRRLLLMTHFSAVMAMLTGLGLLHSWLLIAPDYMKQGWLHAKLLLVLLLVLYHLWCWALVRAFANDANRHSAVWYRWFNELPLLLLLAVVTLVVIKPF